MVQGAGEHSRLSLCLAAVAVAAVIAWFVTAASTERTSSEKKSSEKTSRELAPVTNSVDVKEEASTTIEYENPSPACQICQRITFCSPLNNEVVFRTGSYREAAKTVLALVGKPSARIEKKIWKELAPLDGFLPNLQHWFTVHHMLLSSFLLIWGFGYYVFHDLLPKFPGFRSNPGLFASGCYSVIGLAGQLFCHVMVVDQPSRIQTASKQPIHRPCVRARF
jgi:hypothetical protein